MNRLKKKIVHGAIIRVTQDAEGIWFEHRSEDNIIENISGRASRYCHEVIDGKSLMAIGDFTEEDVLEVLNMKLRDIIEVLPNAKV